MTAGQGRIVVITGASAGIGAALAELRAVPRSSSWLGAQKP